MLTRTGFEAIRLPAFIQSARLIHAFRRVFAPSTAIIGHTSDTVRKDFARYGTISKVERATTKCKQWPRSVSGHTAKIVAPL